MGAFKAVINEALFQMLSKPRAPIFWRQEIVYTKVGKSWHASLRIPDFEYEQREVNERNAWLKANPTGWRSYKTKSYVCTGLGRTQKKAREAMWRDVRKRAARTYEYARRFDVTQLPCSINDYTRHMMRQESFYRRIMPPMAIENVEIIARTPEGRYNWTKHKTLAEKANDAAKAKADRPPG